MADSPVATSELRQSLSARLDPSAVSPDTCSLVSQLAGEMASRWQKGERPLAEEFFARHSELRGQPDGALRLICEELCLRQEFNEEQSAEDMLARFPSWRARLEVLLDCQRLLQPETVAPSFPEIGEMLGDFELIGALGRGAQGRVFLAIQSQLADRPVVLKVTAQTGEEHLSLARLQHTHIVPLYLAQDEPSRHLRILCMPYFGGTALDGILHSMKDTPLGKRTGQGFIRALDNAQANVPIALPKSSPARQILGRASYVSAICSITACLADALHYAHERDLVHLDLKPSNVLMAADAQPMLLDFHLARPPIAPDGKTLEWIGGTVMYMSPEQREAMQLVQAGMPVKRRVDGRSDIYSLGLLLYEALGGTLEKLGTSSLASLHRINPQVSVGLADVIARCVDSDPEKRYPDAGSLAQDLRRHLAYQPLRGVRNRSLRERYRKWRYRKPHALTVWFLVLALIVGSAAFGAYRFAEHGRQVQHIEKALRDGDALYEKKDFAEARRVLDGGLNEARNLPGQEAQVARFEQSLGRVRQAQLGQDLHGLADRVRVLFDAESLAPERMQVLESACRSVWDAREELRRQRPAQAAEQFQADMLDLAIVWTSLRVRTAPEAQFQAVRRDGLQILTEAETMFGASAALCRERQALAESLGMVELAHEAGECAARMEPRTAWEHYSLGRTLLRGGDLAGAREHFDRAVQLEPQGFWANFYQGTCAYRLGKPADAVNAFRVCIALAPEKAECYFNRGLSYQALGQLDAAVGDYGKALQLEPTLAAAAFNRASIHLREKHHREAIADLQQALANGSDAAQVHYHLALAYAALKEPSRAQEHLRDALARRPGYREARELLDQLQRGK